MLLENKCPKCGGLCDIGKPPMEYNCPRCVLCFGIVPDGNFSIGLQNPSPNWFKEPWFMEMVQMIRKFYPYYEPYALKGLGAILALSLSLQNYGL